MNIESEKILENRKFVWNAVNQVLTEEYVSGEASDSVCIVVATHVG